VVSVVVGAKRTLATAGLLLVLCLSLPALVHAAAAQQPTNAISLSPFLQNITVQPNESTKTFELELTNRSPNLQEIDLSTHDFGSLNDTGGVLLKGSNDAYSQRYGLTSWMTLEADTAVLNPGESRQILVSINNRQDLRPGGHYGAVVATVKSLDDTSGNHVVVNQQLLSLVLVDKQGGAHYDLKLASIEQNGNWLHLPYKIKLHFRNPGNVHVTPRGQVLLKNPAGGVVAQGVINSDSAYILPASFRDVYAYLTPTGRNLPLPGIYHVEVDYRYDGLNAVAKKQFAVRFINLKLYVVIIALVAIGIWYFRRSHTTRKTTSKTE
jgi:hypothetical protein